MLDETPEAAGLETAQLQELRDAMEKHLGFLTIGPGHLLNLRAIDQQAQTFWRAGKWVNHLAAFKPEA